MDFNFTDYLDDMASDTMRHTAPVSSQSDPGPNARLVSIGWTEAKGSTSLLSPTGGVCAGIISGAYLSRVLQDDGFQVMFEAPVRSRGGSGITSLSLTYLLSNFSSASLSRMHRHRILSQAVASTDDITTVKLVKGTREHPHNKLIFTFRRPPLVEADFRYLRDSPPGLKTRRATELDWSPDEIDEFGAGAPGTVARGFWKRTPMKFGLWLTYGFTFICNRAELERVTTALSRLRTLERTRGEKMEFENSGLGGDVVNGTERRGWLRDDPAPPLDDLLAIQKHPFNVRYLVMGLVGQGLLLECEGGPKCFARPSLDSSRAVANLFHLLLPVHKHHRPTILRALFRLDRRVLVGSGLAKQVGALTRHLGDPQPPIHKLPGGRFAIMRVVVTPTRVMPFPASIETGNRVLRAWPDEVIDGRIIRVGFADEDGRMKMKKALVEAEEVDPDRGLLARVHNVLVNGVWVAGRLYVFLAAGESQLKDHSCWMVCETGAFTADAVRKQMGDFSKEQVVAKYAARMGLCFSATKHVVQLDMGDIEDLPDVTHGKYTFTDGVGNCSQALASLCAKALGKIAEPSAIQIRMGGIKGVLSVHPHLEDNQVCIRPTMRKFDSPLRDLGVMKVSGFAPAHLNRQAILIMEALGTNIRALLDKFKEQIHHANNLENDLRSLTPARYGTRKLYQKAMIPIAKMFKAGLEKHVLVKNVLRCIKCQLLRDLKYRARLLVPEGAFLMGIADEYDTKKSKRDLPSMLGGGDLDGDFYTLIYDKELQITREHEAMDYTPVVPLRKDRIAISDICQFVVDFIRSDILGLVASDIMALSDHLGPTHPDCLELAKINSDAVDFAKSGVPVHQPSHLRPTHFPDFMDKDPLRSYKSTHVLGMMFRLIEPAPTYEGSDDVHVERRFTTRKVPPTYLKFAGEMKQTYDVELEGMMRQHSLCEAEIIAGVSIMNEHKRRRAADDAMRGPVREGIEALRYQFRRDARRFVKDNPSGNAMENWALACYQVTHVAEFRQRFVDALNPSRLGSAGVSSVGGYASDDDDDEEEQVYGEVKRRELVSFPWIWADELCHSVSENVIKEEDEEDEDLLEAWCSPWDEGDEDNNRARPTDGPQVALKKEEEEEIVITGHKPGREVIVLDDD
ncbi:unnamed protein product [Mycena citricolor]|uniref:RNA-dependent RNA polymerase n=1 Tax=Mycena citricolor TaxID=2018698 RepID=A0AAD2HU84_9AGAR|nr:unnamed protein product [Mycena citricolor]